MPCLDRDVLLGQVCFAQERFNIGDGFGFGEGGFV